MRIAIVGLGLIGGSMAKRLSKYNDCYGIDKDEFTLQHAISDGAIISGIGINELGNNDIIVIALPPKATLKFIDMNHSLFQSATVCDVCGVKAVVEDAAKSYNIDYVGLHPMAGREFSGYNFAVEDMFDGANLIVTGNINAKLQTMITQLGFGRIICTSSAHHDEVIAYTSQLCHVVSNAYAKSPSAQYADGYSGGSFEDLSRVGKLDAELWTQLFMMNKTPLMNELDSIITHLQEYKDALSKNNPELLYKLLLDGSQRAEKLPRR